MLSCEKATELIEKKKLFKLSRIEKIQLFMHTSVCKYCARYEKQSTLLDDFFKAQIEHEPKIAEKELNIDLSALKRKINEKIKE